MTAVEQIQLMQDATVFVGPPGGGSFIGMFLEHRAVMLMFDVFVENQSTPFSYPVYTNEHVLFDSMSNLDFRRYEVTSEEFFLDRVVKPFQNTYHSTVYFADYTIDIKKLIQATHEAVEIAQRNMYYFMSN